MERLPLELHEHIFAYLLAPRRDWTNIIVAPISTKTERADIYNLRLTCRLVKRATTQAFAQIVGDVPTKCTEESLRILTNLIRLEDVSKSITCLTFDTCKLLIVERRPLSQLNIQCVRQEIWITRSLHDEVLAIFQKTPRLRHMIYFLEAMRGSKTLHFSTMQLVGLEIYVGNIPDPMHYIQNALQSLGINKNLETMTILTSSYEGVYEAEPSQEEKSSIEYPNLKHLTLSPSYLEISQVRVICPNLTSLHIVLDNGGDPQYPGSDKGLPANDIQPSLRSITISGKKDYVDTALLIQCVVPITNQIPCLPLLTIRDMIAFWDINYGVDRLPGEGRFQELRFEDVTWCWIDSMDEMVLRGPTSPIDLIPDWKALPRLCERADIVVMSRDGVDREMKPSEWEGGEGDN